MKRGWGGLVKAGLFALAMAGLAGGALWWQASQPIALPGPVVGFTVARGETMRQVAQRVAQSGAGVSPALLYWLARLSGKADRIRAGSYDIEAGMNLFALIDRLARGEVAQASLTVPEGWRFAQLREALLRHPDLLPDIAALSDADVLQKLGIDAPHPEGLFFPDTYVFDKRVGALSVLETAHAAMQRRLAAIWATRDAQLPLKSPYELLILASIVEKETGMAEDRGRVASVFANRLRLGMRLQTDPTVIYGLGSDFDGRLRRLHLETDHPWNTYTRAGLPPTPIALPGEASLKAAARPEQTPFLYFVARGDGSSEFSRNLADHNRAVHRYLKGGGQ